MTRRPWLSGETDLLRAMYPDTPTERIARLVGRPLRSVYAKAKSLGLGKSAAYYQHHQAGRLQGERGMAYRFRPGQPAWNKGTHYRAGGRSVETRFKPGRPAQDAHNYLPIGTTRRHRSDYLEKKVTDDPGIYPAGRWAAVHRLVWEAAHGPVPPGYIVVFRPGMKTYVEAEITVDRLELLTRRENMLRNSHHANFPREVSEIIQLRAALTRKIRNRENRHEPQDHQ